MKEGWWGNDTLGFLTKKTFATRIAHLMLQVSDVKLNPALLY